MDRREPRRPGELPAHALRGAEPPDRARGPRAALDDGLDRYRVLSLPPGAELQCAVRMGSMVVIVEGPGAGREFDLAGILVAGRDPAAAIPLEDPEASRQHASITAQEGGAVVEDLGSTNGTFVGELRITEAHTLQPGDRIRIGTTVIELREGVAAAAPPPPAAAPPPAPGPEAGGAP